MSVMKERVWGMRVSVVDKSVGGCVHAWLGVCAFRCDCVGVLVEKNEINSNK